ncbi:MAG: NYN domain-containing protein [Caldilineaceae bacterium]|nr:NYN domain-containing protein [Caldilineaceae bacterium]
MTDPARAQVALLIDFENLVYGLQDIHGDAYTEEVDPELLFRLSEEYGQVVLANAYADWRFREVNQFQTDLYRLGVELIHVFAKKQLARYKNAVDVKMAVDAIETIWKLPHVDVFVIVSGDRDFIHVLKTLRRYGKTIIGVSPAASVSDDFAALCDRFIRYGALASTYGAESVASVTSVPVNHGLDLVRETLRRIVSERPNGLKGALIKPLLRRRLSVTFDESEYGFSRMTDLLLAMPDVVQVVFDPTGGDVTVRPSDAKNATGPVVASSDPRARRELLISRAGLRNYRFEPDPTIRRQVLQELFETMGTGLPFTPGDVFEKILEEDESLSMSLSLLSKYHAILWQSRIFQLERNQPDRPMRERLMRLDPTVLTADDLIYRYEASITYKLVTAARELGEAITPESLCEIMGLEVNEENCAYCERLITYATI